MTVVESLQKAQFIVDADGTKRAVILDYDVWERLLTLLEDTEDAAEMESLRDAGEESISWEEAKEALRAEGVDV